MPLANAVGIYQPSTEIGYAEFTAAVTVSATTEALANTVVTSASYTFDGVTAVQIEFFGPVATWNGGTGIVVVLRDDTAGTIVGQLFTNGTASGTQQIKDSRRITPAAGARVYSVRAYIPGGGTASITGGAGGSGTLLPGYIRISRVETSTLVPIPVASVAPTVVTALPGSPVDQQLVIYTDSLTVPTYSWLLMYSLAALKWLFIGGTPKYGVSGMTVPLAGIYRIGIGVRSNATGTQLNGNFTWTGGGLTLAAGGGITSGTTANNYGIAGEVSGVTASALAAAAAITPTVAGTTTGLYVWAHPVTI